MSKSIIVSGAITAGVLVASAAFAMFATVSALKMLEAASNSTSDDITLGSI